MYNTKIYLQLAKLPLKIMEDAYCTVVAMWQRIRLTDENVNGCRFSACPVHRNQPWASYWPI